MRARLVRPEFWEDSLLGAMPDPVRLFYIGTWGMADDAGFLEWDTRSIAMKLYGFQKGTIDAHTRRVEQLAQVLIDAGRIELLDCQRHGFIPTLERHRITGGNKSEPVKKVHDTESAGRVRTPRDKPPRTPGNGEVRTRPAISRSSSLSLSLSDSESPSPRPRRNGSKDPDEEKAQAIARAQERLADPAASDDIKRAARFALEQMGVQPA